MTQLPTHPSNGAVSGEYASLKLDSPCCLAQQHVRNGDLNPSFGSGSGLRVGLVGLGCTFNRCRVWWLSVGRVRAFVRCSFQCGLSIGTAHPH